MTESTMPHKATPNVNVIKLFFFFFVSDAAASFPVANVIRLFTLVSYDFS